AAVSVPFVAAATPMGRSLLGDSPIVPQRASAAVSGTGLGFQPITLTDADEEQWPAGYSRKVLLRWGDPLFPGVERLTMENATAELQQQTFGYNCDLNLWFSLERRGSRDARGLLWVNHEYTEGQRMF